MPRFTDELDHAIVRLLEQDGRLPNLEIARRLGVSESAVRKRLARLVQQKGLRIVASVEGLARGTEMLFLIHAEAGHRLGVAERLAALPGVLQVAVTTGNYDIVVRAAFHTDADALDFLVQHVEGASGVRSAQTSHVLKNLPAYGQMAAGSALPARAGSSEAALAGFVLDVARASSVAEVIELGCETVITYLGADRVSIYLVDEAPGRLVQRGSRGLSARYLQAIDEQLRENWGVGLRVWKRRVHLYVEDAAASPLLEGAHDVIREEGYRSLLFLPALYGERIIGTVGLYSNAIRRYTDDEIAVAQAFADQLAIALVRQEHGDSSATESLVTAGQVASGLAPVDLFMQGLA